MGSLDYDSADSNRGNPDRANEGHPMTRSLLIAALLVGAACAAPQPGLTSEHAAAMRDSVTTFMAEVAAGVSAGSSPAWLDHFEASPEFLMASDGRVAFASHEEAVKAVTAMARGFRGIDLAWGTVRVDPIAPGIAHVGADYREAITDTAGAVVRFGGYLTAVARHGADGWRLMTLHWSSPMENAP